MVQGLFASFLKTKGYAQADRAKGKFRTFLFASLKHYDGEHLGRRSCAQTRRDRGFVLLDSEVEAAEALHVSECEAAALDEEQAYEQRWANTLVAWFLAPAPLFHCFHPFCNSERFSLLERSERQIRSIRTKQT